MSAPPISPIVILLVEDSEDDVILLRRTIRKTTAAVDVRHVEDGRQALRYLAGEGAFADRTLHPLPALVLLDLKLPHVHGLDVLQWIRARRDLEAVCVTVLTSSPEPSDVDAAFRLGANCYLTKPASADTVRELLAQWDVRWRTGGERGLLPLAAAELPPGPSAHILG